MTKFIVCGDCQSRKSLIKEMENAPGTTAILGDHAALWDFDIGIDLYTLPFYFLESINLFGKNDISTVDKSSIFNVMVNKKLDHRYLTLRLIEFFDLKDFIYTYSGSAKNINDSRIFQELDFFDPKRQMFPPDLMMQILGDVTLAPVFFGVDNFLKTSVSKGCIKEYGNIYGTWKSGLDQMFNSTTISLVTESDNGDHDTVTVFTEKTLYAVLGLTIPIWPGGYRHADMFEAMGFDVFSDLVDHSYQFMRCWRAFKDNLAMLQDPSFIEIRQDIMPRLLSNRDHLFSRSLIDWYHHGMKTWPLEITNFIYTRYKSLDPSLRID